MRLTGKVAIVTGAGSGFGAEIARRFAAEGAKVVVNDINEEGGNAVAEDIVRANGAASFHRADVSVGEEMRGLVDAATSAYGGLDIMVNNAGYAHRNRPMTEVDEATFERIFAVNVKAIYLSAMHAVPVFRERGGGVFVNIASTAGIRPRPGLT
jgi:3-oxoacyl-[acyl-carrier protein] reductase